ncbi:MAG: HD domain-containing protein, partial [Pseudomonadota bacterium]
MVARNGQIAVSATTRPEPGKLGKTIKAYRLIASTLDDERALIGPVSAAWRNAEIETVIPVREIAKATLDTVRGREILASVFFPGTPLDPFDRRLQDIDPAHPGWDQLINTNRLPKLEPSINGVVLAGVIMQGVRRFGGQGGGDRRISANLVVATLIHSCLDKRDRLLTLDRDLAPVVDNAYIEREFGRQVAVHVRNIRQHYADFLDAWKLGETSHLSVSPRYANVIASVVSARLRLSSRAAGEEIIATLCADKRHELQEAGIDTRGAFPERTQLEIDYNMTRAAFALPGVDYHALREPLEHTLLQAVHDVLRDARKRHRLVGRRGRAVHEVHNNLPLMEYFDAAAWPNDINTLHLAALEVTRHLDKCRRKSRVTMVSHAFCLADAAWREFGENLDVSTAAAAMMHDVVEDGSSAVAGYYHSLRLLRKRFGAPIAAMVGEVTDARNATQGTLKAHQTLESPGLRTVRAAYDVGRYTTMRIRPTDARTPYTVAGIITKLVDTMTTFNESVRDPDRLEGWWRHSGIRIYWAERVRGPIIRPLIEKLTGEIVQHRHDPGYRDQLGLPQSMMEGMVALVDETLDAADRYMAQNLAILASEYGLTPDEEGELIACFTDPELGQDALKARVLDTLLVDDKLGERVARGEVPTFGHVALFSRDSCPERGRNESTFLGYRDS